MNKIQRIDSNKMFLTIGIVVILTVFLTNTLSLNKVFAVDNGGYTFLDCVYDNDTNRETCCDGPDGNVKCLECDVNLETGQKSNCKEVPNALEGTNDQNPGLLSDGNIVEEKDPVKQPQFQGKFSSSLETSK